MPDRIDICATSPVAQYSPTSLSGRSYEGSDDLPMERISRLARHRWLFAWPAKFADNWGSLPAAPIFYATLLAGAVHVVLFDPASGGADDIVIEHWPALAWRFLAVLSPILAMVAGFLIAHTNGHLRASALWLRLAGDFGLGTTLGTFLLGRLVEDSSEYDDPRIYLTYALIGASGFIWMLVLRDIWILLQVEEITRELERLKREEEARA